MLSLVDQVDVELVKFSLIKSSLIAYARPFSGNESVFRAKRKWKLPDSLIPECMLKQHSKAIEYRDKVIAHTDITYRNPKLFPGHHFAICHDAPGFNELFEFSKDLSELSFQVLERLWVEIKKYEREFL